MKIASPKLAAAKEFAYKLLSYRDRSRKEIEERLLVKGFSAAIAGKVIADLKSLRLIDDYKFAKAFAEARLKYRPSGLKLLRLDLQAKGIADDVISSIIENLESGYDEYSAAYGLALERKRQCRNCDAVKAKRRIYDYLMRRAFDRDVVYKVIREIFVS